jgi:hypothetical protein
MFEHCQVKFRPKDVWFLYDNKDFFNRYIFIGQCPKCKKLFVKILQTRMIDNEKFETVQVGKRASRILTQNVTQVRIKQSEIAQKRAKAITLKGINYGTNVEYKNGDIAQYSTSFVCDKKILVQKIKQS